jgi:S-adenosylmethionine:tRNA ribosyltransferase-isomerase
MKTSDFDYFLPKELIAYFPKEKRDTSKLLVLHRKSGEIEHKAFSDILDYIQSGDVLVLNDTKVIPARLLGYKEKTKGKVEVLILKNIQGKIWEGLVNPSRRVKVGQPLIFDDLLLKGKILEKKESGTSLIEFDFSGNFFQIIEKLGKVPLPPYIKRESKEEDKRNYQTVFAQKEGAVAAPTAGLHFTKELLERIKNKSAEIVYLTLHVGLGTFRPIKVDDFKEHKVEEEFFEISPETAKRINQAKKEKRRVIACGTTSVRSLETASENSKNDFVQPQKGWTNQFIYPPYEFKIVDGLITNFHLPQSSLLLLVSAFAGRELILKAYQEAVARRYRFYSYGDAMLIL